MGSGALHTRRASRRCVARSWQFRDAFVEPIQGLGAMTCDCSGRSMRPWLASRVACPSSSRSGVRANLSEDHHRVNICKETPATLSALRFADLCGRVLPAKSSGTASDSPDSETIRRQQWRYRVRDEVASLAVLDTAVHGTSCRLRNIMLEHRIIGATLVDAIEKGL